MRENAIQALQSAFEDYTNGSADISALYNAFKVGFKLFVDEGHSADISFWFKRLMLAMPAAREYSGREHVYDCQSYFKAFTAFCMTPSGQVKHQFSLDKSLADVIDALGFRSVDSWGESGRNICPAAMLPIRLGFESLLVGNSKSNAYAQQMSMFREALCVQPPDIDLHPVGGGIPPFIEQNLYYLKNNLTLWHHLLASGGLRLPTIDLPGCEATYLAPIGTIVISERLGSLIAYPFFFGSILICPIYSGWINRLESLYLVDLQESTTGFVCDTEGTLFLFETRFKSMLNFSLLHLLGCRELIEKRAVNELHLLIGQRINFGHTIIQDSTFLDALKAFAPPERPSILIGKYDYLCTIQQLSQHDELSQTRSTFIQNYCISPNIYVMPGMECYAIPSYRPTAKSLAMLGVSKAKSCASPRTAVYLHIDERSGQRSCLNYSRVVECIVELCHLSLVETIILDSLTALPSPSLQQQPMNCDSCVDALIPPAAYLSALEQLKLFAGEVIGTHGMTILQKQSIWSSYKVLSAVVSYGSSMMSPIYIINCPTVIFGYEIHDRALTEWRWHTSRYCFEARTEDEYFVSSEVTPSGFNVNVAHLSDTLSRLLPAI